MSAMRRIYARLRGRPYIPSGVQLGERTWVGKNVRFDDTNSFLIRLGSDVTVADGARILCHDASSVRRTGLTWVAPVVIEDGAFVGVDSAIMPGVTVGADHRGRGCGRHLGRPQGRRGGRCAREAHLLGRGARRQACREGPHVRRLRATYRPGALTAEQEAELAGPPRGAAVSSTVADLKAAGVRGSRRERRGTGLGPVPACRACG